MRIALPLALTLLAAPAPTQPPVPAPLRAPTPQQRPADPPLFALECADPVGTSAALTDLPLVRALLATPLLRRRVELDAGLAALTDALGAPPRAVLASLADGGLSARVDLVRLRPVLAVVAHARDGVAARARIEVALARLLAREAPGTRPNDLRTAVDGAELWTLDEALFVAHADGVTVLAGDRETALAALAEPPPGADGPALVATLELERLRNLAALGGDDGLRELAAAADDPEARLGLGDGLSSLGAAERLRLTLAVDERGADLELTALGDAVRGATDAAPAPNLPAHPADLVRLRTTRDLAAFVRGTEGLADERSARLARQLGKLEPVLGGFDLRREVLPAIGADWQVVVRAIPFERAPRPDLDLPAAALVVPLADPGLREPLVAAFQNVVALRNVEAAQEGGARPRLLRLAEVRSDGALSSAHLVAPRPGEPVDAAYNLAPTLAAVGPWLVLGTHEELVLDLLDELPGAQGGVAPPPPGTGAGGERLTLDLGGLAELLEHHADALSLAVALRRTLPEAEVRAALGRLAQGLRDQGGLALELEPVAGGARLALRLGGRAL